MLWGESLRLLRRGLRDGVSLLPCGAVTSWLRLAIPDPRSSETCRRPPLDLRGHDKNEMKELDPPGRSRNKLFFILQLPVINF